jgi:hypothetical protein
MSGHTRAEQTGFLSAWLSPIVSGLVRRYVHPEAVGLKERSEEHRRNEPALALPPKDHQDLLQPLAHFLQIVVTPCPGKWQA